MSIQFYSPRHRTIRHPDWHTTSILISDYDDYPWQILKWAYSFALPAHAYSHTLRTVLPPLLLISRVWLVAETEKHSKRIQVLYKSHYGKHACHQLCFQENQQTYVVRAQGIAFALEASHLSLTFYNNMMPRTTVHFSVIQTGPSTVTIDEDRIHNIVCIDHVTPTHTN